MTPKGFEPAVPAGERPQNYTLDRKARAMVFSYFIHSNQTTQTEICVLRILK